MALSRPCPPYSPLLGVPRADPCAVCGRRKVTVYWQRGQAATASYTCVEGWGLVHSACGALLRAGKLQARMFEEVAHD